MSILDILQCIKRHTAI